MFEHKEFRFLKLGRLFLSFLCISNAINAQSRIAALASSDKDIVIYTSNHYKIEMNDFMMSFIFKKHALSQQAINVYQENNYLDSYIGEKSVFKGDSIGLFLYQTVTFIYTSDAVRRELVNAIKNKDVKFWGIDCESSFITPLRLLADTTRGYLRGQNLPTTLIDSLNLLWMSGINHYAYKMEKSEFDQIQNIYNLLLSIKNVDNFYLRTWKPVLDYMRWVYTRPLENFYMTSSCERKIELDKYRDSVLFKNYVTDRKSSNVILMGSMHSQRMVYDDLQVGARGFGDYFNSSSLEKPLRIFITVNKVKLGKFSTEDFGDGKIRVFDMAEVKKNFPMKVYCDKEFDFPWYKSFDYVIQIL